MGAAEAMGQSVQWGHTKGKALLIAADVPLNLQAEGALAKWSWCTVVQRQAARSKESFLTEAGRDGLWDALVDLLLLASCDELVVSPMTTFGGLAHALAIQGAPPWKATSFGACVREATAEPFFHHWQDVY